MCARYEYKTLVSDLMEAYDLPEAPALPNQSEIRPTDVAVVVHQDRTTATQPWGFQVDWTKQPMINARAETLTEKPTFRPWLQSRCIVPASASRSTQILSQRVRWRSYRLRDWSTALRADDERASLFSETCAAESSRTQSKFRPPLRRASLPQRRPQHHPNRRQG